MATVEHGGMSRLKVLKSVAGIPPCYVAPELIRPVQTGYMVEIDANVSSVPWRLIGKTVRATVIGG
jgi:hypothetical protein